MTQVASRTHCFERPFRPPGLEDIWTVGEPMQWHMLDLPPLPEGLAELPLSLRCEGGLHSPAALGRGTDGRSLGVSVTSVLLLP